MRQTIKELDPSLGNRKRFIELTDRFEDLLRQTDALIIDGLRGSAGETLLQKLCDENLDKFIDVLFENGSPEINSRRANAVGFETDSDFPLLKAAHNGDVK